MRIEDTTTAAPPCNTFGCYMYCTYASYRGNGPGFAVTGTAEKINLLISYLHLSNCASIYKSDNGKYIKVAFSAYFANTVIDKIKELGLDKEDMPNGFFNS